MVAVSARFVVAFFSFAAIALQYSLKVNLSVALIAMVESPATNSSGSNSTHPNQSPSQTAAGGALPWDEWKRGQALASYYYGYMATQLLGGWASDLLGARLICGPALLIAGLLSLASAPAAIAGLPVFMAVRIAVGAASGVVIPSINHLISKWLPPKERTELTGIIFSAPSFGTLVGMGVSGLLITATDWPVVFYVFGALCVVWFVPWMLLIYDSPTEHPRISEEEKLYILHELGEDINGRKESLPVPWLKLLTSVPVWAAILFHSGTALFIFTLLNELPSYLKMIVHMDIRESGLLSSLPYLCSWISGSMFGVLSKWIMEKGWLSRLQTYKVFNGIVGGWSYGMTCDSGLVRAAIGGGGNEISSVSVTVMAGGSPLGSSQTDQVFS